MSIRIRVATAEDVPVLRDLIEASVRELQGEDYTEGQIDGALRTGFGVDSQLIADGTYLVAQTDGYEVLGSAGLAGAQSALSRIAGGEGWSKRKTLYGGDRCPGREDSLLDPRVDAAKIRAFFVNP